MVFLSVVLCVCLSYCKHVYRCTYLSVYLFIIWPSLLSVFLTVEKSIYAPQSVYHFDNCLSLGLSSRLSIFYCLYVIQWTSLSVYLSVCILICMSFNFVCLSICTSIRCVSVIRLFVPISVCIIILLFPMQCMFFICLFVCLLVCLPLRLFVGLSIRRPSVCAYACYYWKNKDEIFKLIFDILSPLRCRSNSRNAPPT